LTSIGIHCVIDLCEKGRVVAGGGRGGFGMSSGSLLTNRAVEGDSRKNSNVADFVDGVVILPGQRFCTTQIPVCL